MGNPYAPRTYVPNTVAARSKKTAQDVRADVTVDQRTASEPDVTVDTVTVPDGNVREIVEWIGDDPERARAALEAEGEDSRKGVISHAKEVLSE